jgi:uncharacterized protein (TIGR02145 family)
VIPFDFNFNYPFTFLKGEYSMNFITFTKLWRMLLLSAVLVVVFVGTVVAQAGSFTDGRNGKTYKTVKIGGQTWMAENLNYQIGKSYCYDDNNSNCDKYGRLYEWETATDICPTGWKLPSIADWKQLAKTAGGTEGEERIQGQKVVFFDGIAKKLKAKSGWNGNGNGTDDFGFSALPGGGRDNMGDFFNVGDGGGWWTASFDRNSGAVAWRYGMYYKDSKITERWNNMKMGYSVRCIQE